MATLIYCDKCGNIGDALNPEKQICYCCGNTPLLSIPRKYTDNFRWRDGDGKQAFIEEVIKTSPNLDWELFNNRKQIINEKNERERISMEAGKAILEERERSSKCPSCGSSNVSKISAVGRMVSVGLLGLASSKIGKTHKCNSCGTAW